MWFSLLVIDFLHAMYLLVLDPRCSVIIVKQLQKPVSLLCVVTAHNKAKP